MTDLTNKNPARALRELPDRDSSWLHHAVREGADIISMKAEEAAMQAEALIKLQQQQMGRGPQLVGDAGVTARSPQADALRRQSEAMQAAASCVQAALAGDVVGVAEVATAVHAEVVRALDKLELPDVDPNLDRVGRDAARSARSSLIAEEAASVVDAVLERLG